MKNFLLIFILIFLFSCGKDADTISESLETRNKKEIFSAKVPAAVKLFWKEHEKVIMSKTNKKNGELNISSLPQYEVDQLYYSAKSAIYSVGIDDSMISSEWDPNDKGLTIVFGYALSGYYELDSETCSICVAKFDGEKIYNCVMRALGVEALFDLWHTRSLSSYAGKKLFIRSIGKVATRYLGVVGGVLAVADFTYCMGS